METVELCNSKGRQIYVSLCKWAAHWDCAELYKSTSPKAMGESSLGCKVWTWNEFPRNFLCRVCVARTLVPSERTQGNAFFPAQMSLELASWKKGFQVLPKGRLLVLLMDVMCFNKIMLMRVNEGSRVPVLGCSFPSLLALLHITQ